jgi:O-antigen/teichoic acid export membrane protein
MLARVAAGMAITQVAGMALTMVAGLVLARILGPHGLGIYSLAMSIVAVAAIPTEFGLPTYLMREAAAAHVRNDWGYLGAALRWCSRTVLLLSVAVVAVVATVVLALKAQLGAELTLAILAALPIVPLSAQTKIWEAALRGMNLQVLAQIPMLVARPATFLAGLAVAASIIGLSLSAWGVMALHALAMVFVALTIMALFERNAPPDVRRAAAHAFDGRAALRAALPMAMTEGLRVLNGHIAVFLLGTLASAGAVGQFKVADTVGLLCVLPSSILNVVAAPQIARLQAANDTARLKQLVSYVALGMTAGCFALALPIVLFGDTVLSIMFGPAFADAQAPMLILCVGYAAGAMVGPSAVFMNMTGREGTVARSIAIAFLANLALGSVAISYAGAAGAAFANVLSFFIWNGWLWREARRQAGVDTSLVPALSALFRSRLRD